MKASDYIIKYLESAGVTHIFGYIGGAVTHIIDSLCKNGNVRFVQFGHEQAAAFGASAYAKYTGKVGVAVATSGPGATNLITGIADAYFDSAPTVFITGQVNTYDFKYTSGVRQKGFQETDIVSIVRPITKYSIMIDDINNLEKELVKSFSIALNGRKGPVLIDIPMDIQRQDMHVRRESFVYPIKKDTVNIENELLNTVLEMIKTSSFPLVLAGGGVRSSCAELNLVRFSELLGVPVVVSLMGKDSFPNDHKYYAGFIGAYGNRFGNLALAKSDCLLVLGSRLDSRQTGNILKPFHDKKIIWVDIDKNEIECGKIKPDIGIIADVDSFLEEMLIHCKSRNIACENNHKILDGINDLKKLFSPLSELDRDHKNNWHYKVMKVISDSLDDNDAICIDVGQNQMMAAQVLTVGKNRRFINSGGLAAMGYALPSAIAISLACKTRSVVIVGDGGLQMNIQELKMVSEHALPVIIIVFNNKSLGMIKQFQELYFEKRYSATDEKNGYKSCDFAGIALAYGINSITIDEKSNLAQEFDQVFNKSELPVLVEVVMDYQTFIYPKLEFNKRIDEISPEVTKEEADMINSCFDHIQ